MSNILKSEVRYHAQTGKLEGDEIKKTIRKLKDVSSIFEDQQSIKDLDPEQVIYEVEGHFPVKEGVEGGLFFGTSYVHPGKVGNEYFMTKGHFHQRRDTAEYYWCIMGEGVLLLMDEEGNVLAEKLEKGSIHYIPGKVAHRIANTGTEILVVGACWPSDAGHDYETIEKMGFGVSVVDHEGEVVIKNANPKIMMK